MQSALLWEDQKYLRQSMHMMPVEWRKPIARRYLRNHKRYGNRVANLDMLTIREMVAGVNKNLALDDDAIRLKARELAIVMKRKLKKGISYARQFLTEIGINHAPAKTETGEAARYQCQHWWRRRLREKHGRQLEHTAIRANIVNFHNQIYASDTTVHHRRTQNARNRAILEEIEATNQLGDSFTLAELSALTVANPKLRRGELMTRIRGFEEFACSVGHQAMFYTISCPSRMHRTHRKSGQENKKYDGTTPRQAQDYLCQQWARARSRLDYRGINYYGFRVCEPHHDGCPHWHLLLFIPKDEVHAVSSTIIKYGLQYDGQEYGARKHRVTIVRIDPKKGTAAGYIAKYIAKNIDGFGIDQDLFGNDPKKASERVGAWAARWGIRQFQQVKGPPVSVWRELRRLREPVQGPVEDARFAADNGDWMQFVKVMGGPVAKRACLPVSLYKSSSFDPETGEIQLNRYHEPAGPQVKGVESAGVVIPTRFYQWSIANVKKKQESGVDSGADLFAYSRHDDGGESIHNIEEYFLTLRGADAPTWTRVNNCTGEINDTEKSAANSQKSRYGKAQNSGNGSGSPGGYGSG